MSDKPKREITLGEMHDECKRIGGICVGIKDNTEDCKFLGVCPNRCDVPARPSRWDLTDPPRFTEAQRALLKALWDIGLKRIETLDTMAFRLKDKSGRHVSLIRAIGLNENETLDLAELFGREGT